MRVIILILLLLLASCTKETKTEMLITHVEITYGSYFVCTLVDGTQPIAVECKTHKHVAKLIQYWEERGYEVIWLGGAE